MSHYACVYTLHSHRIVSAGRWPDWVAAAVSARSEKPKTYAERASQWWNEISWRTMDFDSQTAIDRDVVCGGDAVCARACTLTHTHARVQAVLKTLQHDEAIALVKAYTTPGSMCTRRVTVQRWPSTRARTRMRTCVDVLVV
jgi:hypothetical protein